MTNEISSNISATAISTPTSLGSPTGAESEHVQPAASFVRFPLLPLELREQIWKYALPSGRIIKVKPTSLKDKNIFVEHESMAVWKRSGIALTRGYVHVHPVNVVAFGGFVEVNGPYIPALIHTCRESRQIALPRFELCLPFVPHETNSYVQTLHKRGEPHPDDPRPSPSSLARPGIWFQPDLDTIYFRNNQEDEKLWDALVREIPGAHLMTKFDNVQLVAFEGAYNTMGSLGLLEIVLPGSETRFEKYRAWSGIREVIMILPNDHYLLEDFESEQEADVDEQSRQFASEYTWARHRENSFVCGPYTQVRFVRGKDVMKTFGR